MAKRGTPIRVLVAKPGLDGHDRGAKVVAKALLDAGMEVIYTGRHQTVSQILAAAIQEDVDVIGLSILSAAHLDYSRRIMDGLREQGVDDKIVIVGGCIPRRDIPTMKEMGISEVFPTGSSITDIANYIEEHMQSGTRS